MLPLELETPKLKTRLVGSDNRVSLKEIRASWPVPVALPEIIGRGSKDFNPIHFIPEYAERTLAKRIIAHGVGPWAQVYGLAARNDLSCTAYELTFSAFVYPGEDTLDIYLKRIAGGWGPDYNFVVDVGKANVLVEKDGRKTPLPVMTGSRMSLVPVEQVRFLRKEKHRDNRGIVDREINESIRFYRPDGELIDLPPVVDLKQGTRLVIFTVMTSDMVEAIAESTGGAGAFAELHPPFSISRLLACLAGPDGANGQVLFNYLQGELACGNRLLKAGDIFVTELAVSSHEIKPPKTPDRPYVSKLTCVYSVRNGGNRLISRGSAVVSIAYFGQH